MSTDMPHTTASRPPGASLHGAGIGVGIGVGTAIGVAMGVAGGVVVGVVIGAWMARRGRRG